MLFKTLGTLDLIFGIFLLLMNYLPKDVSIRLGILFLIYSIVKFALFFGDLATFGDFIAGIYGLFACFLFNVPILTILFSIYLLQKAFLTLIA
ncbi:MAG: hypothetical protein QXD62_00490 [Candidatus Woesearchaeota archaeon]